MNRRSLCIFAALSLGACAKPALLANSSPTVTLLGIEVKVDQEIRRAGPHAALPVPGTVALFVQVNQAGYLSLARQSGTAPPALLARSDSPVSASPTGSPLRFPSGGQWLHMDELADGDRLCLSAHSEPAARPDDPCGAGSILLRWSRDKGETHPQPAPPAPETKAPPEPPPPPPPPRTDGAR